MIENIIEQQIFRPFLLLNGLDAHVEISWGLPSEESINARLTALTSVLSNMSLSPELRAMVEIDIANKLGYDEKEVETLLLTAIGSVIVHVLFADFRQSIPSSAQIHETDARRCTREDAERGDRSGE